MIMAKDLSTRYGAIDTVRAIAIINMVVFHFLYDYFAMAGALGAFVFNTAVIIWERFICITFIVISGVSLNFTRNGYLRGLIVLLCGFAVTAVTYFFMPEQLILFGVLSFLGCAMILTYALRGLFLRINPWAGAAVSLVLFILFYHIPDVYIGLFSLRLVDLPPALYETGRLAWLGFPAKDFASADYFPLLRWIFLYISGYFLWGGIKRTGLDAYLRKSVPVLGFIGRHSLLIYMIHQPVLYGICCLFFL